MHSNDCVIGQAAAVLTQYAEVAASPEKLWLNVFAQRIGACPSNRLQLVCQGGSCLSSVHLQHKPGRLQGLMRPEQRACSRFVCGENTIVPQVGDDTAALRILAIELEDMVEAERYCAEQGLKGGQATHALLLDMLLHPGQARPPMFAQACHLLAAQGYSCP